MSNVERYANFISEQTYIDEIFGDKDKPYSYVRDENHKLEGHRYEVKLPGELHPGVVHVDSFAITPHRAHVSFSMPTRGRLSSIPDEVHKTYNDAYQRSKKENPEIDQYTAQPHEHHHENALAKVREKHGYEAYEQYSHPGYTHDLHSDHAHHAMKMLSTVVHIMKEHAKKHPEVKQFVFTANKYEGSRKKLYDKISDRFGGKSEISGAYAKYTLPVNQD